MANDTISQVEINGITYDLCDINTLSALNTLKTTVSNLSTSNGQRTTSKAATYISPNSGRFPLSVWGGVKIDNNNYRSGHCFVVISQKWIVPTTIPVTTPWGSMYYGTVNGLTSSDIPATLKTNIGWDPTDYSSIGFSSTSVVSGGAAWIYNDSYVISPASKTIAADTFTIYRIWTWYK